MEPVRAASARGASLGNRGRPETAPALSRVLANDPDALVRSHAAWALGQIGTRHGTGISAGDGLTIGGVLANAANDPDPSVRDEAMATLKKEFDIRYAIIMGADVGKVLGTHGAF